MGREYFDVLGDAVRNVVLYLETGEKGRVCAEDVFEAGDMFIDA
jgi:hypothetical protein